ncbi:MAG TPA: phosphate acyltransferase [Spirochaetota bacterium]|nr:phosphate acyltransferase [Spirochaetota bacterium]
MSDRVKANPRSVVFPEGDDPRVLEAVLRLAGDGLIGRAVMLGDRSILERVAGHKAGPGGVITIFDGNELTADARYREEYRRARGLGSLEGEILDRAMRDPVVLGALMLRLGIVDGFIGGVRTTTADILRTGISVIKADRRVGVVTAFSVVTAREGDDGIYVIADPVVNPDPTAGVLCKIAEAAAVFSRRFLGMNPRIAFLSYSTRGSGAGRSVDKMRLAAARARERMPEIVADGELQLDAALSPDVAKSKAPGSPVEGRANVLVFPNLDSANIGVKLIQRFGSALVIGPVIYGLDRTYNDISRAATVEEIVNLALLTQLQSQAGAASLR